MKRRNFIATLGPLAMAPIALKANDNEPGTDGRQYLEWIRYTLPDGRP